MVLALDLGGTWIKGRVASLDDAPCPPAPPRRWENPLARLSSREEYADFMQDLCRELAGGQVVRAVVASTAGEVDALGCRYKVAGQHLGVMVTTAWRERVAAALGCPFVLINDAEAFLLGWAESGALRVDGNTGALVVGTGLGFAVTRQGRWWKPSRSLHFLGCTCTESGTYDTWTSAVELATRTGGNLVRLWQDATHSARRDDYLDRLARTAATATILYRLDDLVLGGGLAESAATAGFDLAAEISDRIPSLLPPNLRPPCVCATAEGNLLILHGALAFARGLVAGERVRFRGTFAQLATEQAAAPDALEEWTAEQITLRLAEAEQAAAIDFHTHARTLGPLADRLAGVIRSGGRIIYVGAGTSGRLAALDAVEIPCTFGLPPDRFLAVVAGGPADATLTIESEGEEDGSAVPDLLLLQPTPRDAVVGISASGTAHYVRSALAFARQRGSTTILLHEAPADQELSAVLDSEWTLHSGAEVLPGSTRMKAGTATKKALNILSTTALIRLGHVRGGLMVDVVCSNEKLRERGAAVLARLGDLDLDRARSLLARHGYRLRDALSALGR